MYSQNENSTPGLNYDLRLYNSFSFPDEHIHRNSELIIALSGRASVTVGNKRFELENGEAALALPFTPHSFIADNSELAVCVFSNDCVPRFFERLGTKRSGRPIFRTSAASLEYFRNLFSEFFPTENRGVTPISAPELSVIALLYALLERFLADVSFDSEPLIYEKLLDYISRHSSEELTLDSIANFFGYEPHYLSRLLRSSTDLNLRTLINFFRVESAKELLLTDLTITDVALSCGFGSVRSFNRVFKKLCHTTPSEFLRTQNS